MLQRTIVQVVQSLREIPVLDAAHLDEVAFTLVPRCNGPKELLTELVQRGWLTRFQSERLLRGRPEDLQVGPYVLLERLGQGGFGDVFKARHQLLKRIVALKVIRQDIEPEGNKQRRFLREIEATAQLSHPNIVGAHDAGCAEGAHFFAMEYIEGMDLARLVEETGPLSVTRACNYIHHAALGLQHAFEHGLVHRDIKPSNLILTADGSQVKIVDMGLVRLGQGPDEAALTATGAVLGTPDYLSPEQATNARMVDIRADLYSLGCTFYFLLVGRHPFPEGTAVEKLFKHIEAQPTPIRNLRPEVPAAVEAVVQRLMAKKPDDRYQRPIELAEVLQPFCNPADKPQTPATQDLPPSSPPLLSSLKPLMADLPTAAPALVPPAEAPPAKTPEAAPQPAPDRWPSRRRLWLAAGVIIGATCLAACWRPWEAGPGPKPALKNSIGMELVRIEAGEFIMGAPPGEVGRLDDEGPCHKVVISRPFYLAGHETTVGQFRAFIEGTRYQTEAEKNGAGALRWNASSGTWERDRKCTWRNPGWPQTDNQPVVCVSRFDALAFCYWLSRREGKIYRLPTEAEWEYACRAGTRTPYAAGPTLSPQQANFSDLTSSGAITGAGKMTTRVGSFAPNAWGLYDMHGNAWEWCADRFHPTYYRDSPEQDPPGPESGAQGVLRGGSWQSDPFACRSAGRRAAPSDACRTDTGFRVVREAGVR